LPKCYDIKDILPITTILSGETMTVNPLALKIRAKKLGLLIYDARISARRSVHECAQVVGISDSLWECFESGQQSPSLAEIEVLAYFLDIPLDHFWGKSSRSENIPSRQFNNLDRLLLLRQRMIGAMLRQLRTKANLTPQEISAQSSISEPDLRAYELGEKPVPLPELETLASTLGSNMEFFMDQTGVIGEWKMKQQAVQKYLELPKELQDFVSKPVNRPYLELALRLSGLSVEKLRAVAEGLLEITY
jgi:transcriptional regulator with XRE-family HTH domain